MLTSHAVARDSTFHPLVTNPLVTIAIPTFNRAAWLSEGVAAALSQTYLNFEVLVSDNASTDETVEVLRKFNDQRLRVVRRQSNIGLLPNWNACLWEAKGDYIIFVPDDDRIPPWMLERFVALAKREPQVDIIVGQSELFYAAEGTTSRPLSDPSLATGLHDGADVLEEWLKGKLVLTMCSIMFRTEAFRATGGFPLDVKYASDMVAFSRLLFTSRVGLINDCCGIFRVHEDSVTSRLSLNERLSDWKKFPDQIAVMADHYVVDPQRRRRIKLEAKRFFARHAILFLGNYRKAGGKLTTALPAIWFFRRDLSYIEKRNVFSLVRLIARIFCPKRIADWIRQCKQIYQRQPRWDMKSSAR